MSLSKTPLRYPGGKQKLAPFIREVMEANDLIGGHYAEPYAGGAGVAIELLLTGSASHIHLNDSCEAVYSFWRSALSKTDDFCRRISRASLTIEEWRRQRHILKNPDEFGQLDVGFSMFYLNRCNRSGILSGGVIGGLEQTGDWKMDARFPRAELIRRIEAIARRKKNITLRNWDAEKFIRMHLPKIPAKSLVYCDPPYFHKADRLYLNHYAPEDHRRVAKVIQKNLKRPWLVSYDAVPELLNCYSERRSFIYGLQYNASEVYMGKEVFFLSDKLALPKQSSVKSISAGLKSPLKKARTLAVRLAA